MIEAKDVQEIFKNNPQITTATFTCYPNEKDLFWRGFKSTMGGLFAVAFVILGSAVIAKFLVRVL